MTFKGIPLFGHSWNEAESAIGLELCLLTIMANDRDGQPHVIGNAFIIDRTDRAAFAMSAAHVFEEIESLHRSPSLHASTALPEFLPVPRPLILNEKSVWAVSTEGERVEALNIIRVAMNKNQDLAIFEVELQNHSYEPFFHGRIGLDPDVPQIGSLVCILGHILEGPRDVMHTANDWTSLQVGRRVVLRTGRVLEHHPNGHRLCKGPCIETSIPVYSGMSGSPAIHYAEEGEIKAFGIVSTDLDFEGGNKQDRSVEGRSLISLIPCQKIVGSDGECQVSVRLTNIHVLEFYKSGNTIAI